MEGRRCRTLSLRHGRSPLGPRHCLAVSRATRLRAVPFQAAGERVRAGGDGRRAEFPALSSLFCPRPLGPQGEDYGRPRSSGHGIAPSECRARQNGPGRARERRATIGRHASLPRGSVVLRRVPEHECPGGKRSASRGTRPRRTGYQGRGDVSNNLLGSEPHPWTPWSGTPRKGLGSARLALYRPKETMLPSSQTT